MNKEAKSQSALKLALEALENTTPTGFNMETDKRFYEAITAIKEALSEPEPVAWTRKLFSPELGEFFDYKDGAFARETDSEGWTPLYTNPPQRTWVGLTDNEIEALWTSLHDDFANPPSATVYERAIEAKLKQKNGYAEEKNT